jgi:flagellin
MTQGYSLSTSATGVFRNAAGAVATTAVGVLAASGNNSVRAQNLSISGSTGSATVAISDNDDASNIVTKVNAVSGSTNVKAKAVTTATLSGLSATGQISFNLFGDNTTAASISAAVTTTDLSALVKAINDSAGNTGITAAIGTANDQIVLTHSTGKNIRIQGFNHSAAQTYADPTTTAVAADGAGVIAPNVVSIQLTGNASTNTNGTAVTLKAGGTAGMDGQDSGVVGGHLSFTSSSVFSMSSDIAGNVAGTGYFGSLFGVAARGGNTSAAATVNLVDISTIAGANSAIAVLDDAMNQISDVRAGLGAVQSRFESTIRNLSNNIENLNVARSRILDADFAAETAALSKNQILQQAGIAVLSQANALPQGVLKLLS